MPGKKWKTMIYGSGTAGANDSKVEQGMAGSGNVYGTGYNGEEEAIKMRAKEAEMTSEKASEKSVEQIEEVNPFLLPFAIGNKVLSSILSPLTAGQGMGPRNFSLSGEVVPTMKTGDINKKNIF